MSNVKNSKKQFGFFLLLLCYFFSRTGLLVPSDCFGISKSQPFFTFSVETISFTVLLLIFSAVASFLVLMVQKRFGEKASVILFLTLSEPVFFISQVNCLALFVSILGILCVLNITREKPFINKLMALYLFVFISVLLVPHYIMSYAPLALGFFIVSNSKEKKNTLGAIVGSIACAASAFFLSRILCNSVSVFSSFIERFSFADTSETNKTFSLTLAVIPMTVASAAFYNACLKTSKRLAHNATKSKATKTYKENTVIALDLIGILFVFALIGLVFFKSEAFCTINIITPVIALAMIFSKNEVCLAVIDNLSEFIKKHKIIAAVVLMGIYYITLSTIDDYSVGYKLISYIRY